MNHVSHCLLAEYGRLPSREYLNAVGDRFHNEFVLGPLHANQRYRVANINDATYYLIGTPTNPDVEPMLYSKYGGHGLKITINCLPRVTGCWICEVVVITARANDLTAYDMTKTAKVMQQENLRSMGDKGLLSKDRNFVTPYKENTLRRLINMIRKPTRQATRRAQTATRTNLIKFNKDIGHHRYAQARRLVFQLKSLFLLVDGKGLFALLFLKLHAYNCVACCTWLLWNECKLLIIFFTGRTSRI
jgi:hypothetical protein